MYSRKQYLNKECTHDQYYQQFVNDRILAVLKSTFGLEKLQKHVAAEMGEPGYIPLEKWDRLPNYVSSETMKACGDHTTLSSIVCVYKAGACRLVDEAARRLHTRY